MLRLYENIFETLQQYDTNIFAPAISCSLLFMRVWSNTIPYMATEYQGEVSLWAAEAIEGKRLSSRTKKILWSSKQITETLENTSSFDS